MDILALTTSSPEGSVSVRVRGVTQTVSFLSGLFNHSSLLMPSIADAFKKAGASLKDMEAVAVDAGPGSFTGIRLSLACAEAFSLALPVRLFSLSSLDIIAEAAFSSYEEAFSSSRDFVVAVDAGRQEFYCSRYCLVDGKERMKLSPDSLLSEKQVLDMDCDVFGYLSPKNRRSPLGTRMKVMYPSSAGILHLMERTLPSPQQSLFPHYVRSPHVILKKRS